MYNFVLTNIETFKDFANSEPVPGFVEETLELTFVEIRQLLDLILTWDWTSYFADYGTAKSKYLRVNPSRALNVFEKLVESVLLWCGAFKN